MKYLLPLFLLSCLAIAYAGPQDIREETVSGQAVGTINDNFRRVNNDKLDRRPGDILPKSGSVYSLGSDGYKWKTIYVDGIWSTYTYTTTTSNAANVNIDSSGIFRRSTSSRRYKRDIRPYKRGLDAIRNMYPVSFQSRNPDDGDKRHVGLLAEDLDEAGLTEFVVYDSQGRPDAIEYDRLVALLINSIKDLERQVKYLKEASHEKCHISSR